MLGKLLKYEVPAMGRKLGPLYIAWAAASIMLGLSIGSLNGTGFIEILGPLVYAGVSIAVFVMMIVLIIQKYSNSLLGDEAYFNLTMPVSISEHIANKAISALVWTVLTSLAALASGLLILIFSGSMKDLFTSDGWREFWEGIGSLKGKFILLLAEFIIVCILSIVKSILAIYAAITIGHQAKNRTTLASIGAYIALLIGESMIGNICIQLGMNTTIDVSDYTGTQLILLAAFVVTMILSAVYFFICKLLMEKHLNLA
jgi:hypothetical protein